MTQVYTCVYMYTVLEKERGKKEKRGKLCYKVFD